MNRSERNAMHREAPELAAVERRVSERSELARSGTAANSGGALRGEVALPAGNLPPEVLGADSEVPAKAVRRRFTAQYKQSILRQADLCRDAGAIGALLRRGRRAWRIVAPAEAGVSADPKDARTSFHADQGEVRPLVAGGGSSGRGGRCLADPPLHHGP